MVRRGDIKDKPPQKWSSILSTIALGSLRLVSRKLSRLDGENGFVPCEVVACGKKFTIFFLTVIQDHRYLIHSQSSAPSCPHGTEEDWWNSLWHRLSIMHWSLIPSLAILSVYDKQGLLDLAKGLIKHDIRLLASGGTAKRKLLLRNNRFYSWEEILWKH